MTSCPHARGILRAWPRLAMLGVSLMQFSIDNALVRGLVSAGLIGFWMGVLFADLEGTWRRH